MYIIRFCVSVLLAMVTFCTISYSQEGDTTVVNNSDEKGTLINHKKEGEWIYLIDGRIYLKEHYQNGLRHGLIVFYYKSDSIEPLTKERTMNFTNGLINGVARTYNPNGTISSESEFLMDKIHGESKKHYSNGALLSLENYSDGKKHGEFIWFNSEGDTFQISNFVNGKNIGLQKIFKNGIVAEVGFYCDLDSIVTDTTIMINNSFGIVEEEVLIKDGKWVYYDEYQSGKIVECWDCGRKISCDDLDGE